MPTERCTPSAVGSCARATRPAIRTKARGSFAHSGAGHGTVALRAGTVVETCDEKKQGGKQYNDHEIGDESARDQLACDDDADARDDGCDRDAPPPKISSKERCQPSIYRSGAIREHWPMRLHLRFSRALPRPDARDHVPCGACGSSTRL